MSEPFLGEIRAVAFSYAPSGWLPCDGRSLPIQTYSALFSLLGTTFGGDGQTTFKLPDLRGRSMVGMGQGPGLSAITQGELDGSENITLLQTQMPAHAHTAGGTGAPAFNGPGETGDPSGAVVANFANDSGATVNSFAAANKANVTMAPNSASVTGVAGGNQPVPIRNPYNGTNFIMATEGIYPSRP
jgi:microcystin-dependent protein